MPFQSFKLGYRRRFLNGCRFYPAPIPQKSRNRLDHRILAFDYPARLTLVRCLFGVSAVGNKINRFRRHNRPTIAARKTGYVCHVGWFCHDKAVRFEPPAASTRPSVLLSQDSSRGGGRRDTIADAFEPTFQYIAVHLRTD
jgi:hypothetical protein